MDKKSLQGITHFWVQDEASAKHLNNLGIKQVTVAGDSRFDRVYEYAKENKKLPLVAAFKGESKLVVMGSVWPSDFTSDQKTQAQVTYRTAQLKIHPSFTKTF